MARVIQLSEMEPIEPPVRYCQVCFRPRWSYTTAPKWLPGPSGGNTLCIPCGRAFVLQFLKGIMTDVPIEVQLGLIRVQRYCKDLDLDELVHCSQCGDPEPLRFPDDSASKRRSHFSHGPRGATCNDCVDKLKAAFNVLQPSVPTVDGGFEAIPVSRTPPRPSRDCVKKNGPE